MAKTFLTEKIIKKIEEIKRMENIFHSYDIYLIKYGFKAHEKGWNLEKTILELKKIIVKNKK